MPARPTGASVSAPRPPWCSAASDRPTSRSCSGLLPMKRVEASRCSRWRWPSRSVRVRCSRQLRRGRIRLASPASRAIHWLRPWRRFISSRSSSSSGYRPRLALTRKMRSPMRPSCTGRMSPASIAASRWGSAASVSVGRPCWRPKKLKVPRGSAPNGIGCSQSACTTVLSVPSPPAATITPPSLRARATTRAASAGSSAGERGGWTCQRRVPGGSASVSWRVSSSGPPRRPPARGLTIRCSGAVRASIAGRAGCTGFITPGRPCVRQRTTLPRGVALCP